MKALDLRIGNYVSFLETGTDIKTMEEVSFRHNLIVTRIKDTNFCQVSIGYKLKQEDWAVNIGAIEPIPLTEEWLLKFGFDKTGEDDFDKTFGDIKQISIRKTKLFTSNKLGVYYNSTRITIIKYVHQLQNLYFALTGEELKIKEK